VAGILAPAIQRWSALLPSRHVVGVGLILTLLGIAAQFLTPVLDLLGIKIV
jgi:hypothetical protein